MVPKPPPITSQLPPSLVLPTLTVSQLQRLASLCGISKTGRKAVLAARLNAAALAAIAATASTSTPTSARQAEPGTGPERRVLSIDLGLRNLAFSLITVAPQSPSRPRSRASSKLSPSSSSPLHPPRIHLHTWRHQILIKRPLAKGEKKQDLGAEATPEADPFSPASLARTTTALIRDVLLPLRPTHVLLERQRFRSQGRAAVQEWTLRVNTLEAMMHASLQTLREYGIWDTSSSSVATVPGADATANPDKKKKTKTKARAASDEKKESKALMGAQEGGGQVISVAPSRVVQFWIEDLATVEGELRGTPAVDAAIDADIAAAEEEDKGLLSDEVVENVILEDEETEETKTKKKKPKKQKKPPKKKRLSLRAMADRNSKRLKIKLLARWLGPAGDGLVAAATPEAAAMLGAYVRRASGQRPRQRTRPRKGETQEQLRAEAAADEVLGPKLDDLADCLLQGMAWLKWEENKLLLGRDGGVKKLLDE